MTQIPDKPIMGEQFTYDAVEVAKILCRTDSKLRGELMKLVSIILSEQSQYFTSKLCLDWAERYGLISNGK